jgi:hypothetical protein
MLFVFLQILVYILDIYIYLLICNAAQDFGDIGSRVSICRGGAVWCAWGSPHSRQKDTDCRNSLCHIRHLHVCVASFYHGKNFCSSKQQQFAELFWSSMILHIEILLKFGSIFLSVTIVNFLKRSTYITLKFLPE